MTNVTYSRNGKSYEVDTETLKPESIEYLLQYGFAQSLQDSIAGLAKRVELEGIEKKGDADTIAESVDQAIDGQLNKRLDAIVAGTISVRSIGEARDPLKAVANGMVRKALSQKKLKVNKDDFAKRVANLLETNRDKVQAEYDRQKAAAIDVDIEV